MRTNNEFVLILSQHFYPTLIGSAAYITDFSRWMAERGRAVTVVTDRPFYPDYEIAAGYEAGQRDCEEVFGVDVLRLPTYVPKGGRAIKRCINEAVFLAGVVSRLLTGRIKRSTQVVSLCPSIFTVLAGAVATKRSGRHVAIVHDIQSGLAAGLGMLGSGPILRLLQSLERFALNRADSIIVLSEHMREVLQRQGVRRPIEVIPIWVDLNQIFPLPRPDGARPVVLYSGNLGRKQGWDQLIAMVEILRDRRPDIQVVIRGTGSRIDVLQEEIQERRLTNVSLQPLVPAEQLNEGLAAGDVHLVPQDPNGADFAIPSKVYGIMAAGRPFVCTAVPGSPLALLEKQTQSCACVPPNDPDAFADAVIRLASDPALCEGMGQRARDYVAATASRDVVLSRYLDLLLGQSNPATKEIRQLQPALDR
ncbi:glycosyltransferase [Defluviicoccus vanus]|nr:glycosyltransferase [Defluviicoccus vanus]